MALYCIVFDIIAVYCMSPHCILWYGMVFYFIWSYCTVSHCYVPLLQRAGELPRSASSHYIYSKVMCLNVFVKALHCVLVARQIMLSLLEAQSSVKEKDKKHFQK